MQTTADANMLFGVLALQMGFIDQRQLIGASHVWMEDKSRLLGDILVDQNILTDETKQLLEAVVARHLERHGNDAQESLRSITPLTETVSAAAAGMETVTWAVSAGRGRYRVLRPHARGGLGEVFVANDSELNRQVALKQIQQRHADDLDSQARFVLEAEVTGRLEHPGVVPVYSLGRDDAGRPYYAMRFIRGETLQEAIARLHRIEQVSASGTLGHAGPGHSPTGSHQSLDFTRVEFHRLIGRLVTVCQTVEYAHSRGIVHRDIKPGNIMLGPYGETLLVDWGLAKAIDRGEPAVRLCDEPALRPSSASGSAETVEGQAVGTPSYMSPEQAAGRLDLLSFPSDIYSLGATLYALLTGRAPFEGDVATVLRRVAAGEFRPPRAVDSQIPRPLEAVCLKAMATEPLNRYPSAQALADDLEAWLADGAVSAHRERRIERVRRWSRRHRGWVAALSATTLMVIATAMAVILGRSAHREHLARRASEAARDRIVMMAAQLGASAMSSELERRFRTLELAGADSELHELLITFMDAVRDPSAAPSAWSDVQPRIQHWLRTFQARHGKAVDGGQSDRARWFLITHGGHLVARVPQPPAEHEIGRNYSYRDYFHGAGRDYDEDDPTLREPIRRPHRSIVFRNWGDGTLNAALSVPVIGQTEDPAERRVLGVLAMTVAVGDDSLLQLDTSADLMAVLVDTRPDWRGRSGLILQHPLLSDNQEAYLAPERVRALERLRSERRTWLESEYYDPVVPDSETRWLAAFEPVYFRGFTNTAIEDTGWIVIVQQRQ